MAVTGEQVITLCFVFDSINGFFRYSNIRPCYGLLNYLISPAELHCWHHSRISAASNHSYGDNLILWAPVFGTWFLPTARSIYPKSFAAQMRAPFLGVITEAATRAPGRATQTHEPKPHGTRVP
jgi:sterol desaturase/sphingolipid hydroxylase (fatty acid hydroxylase superfamily)